MVEAKLIGTTLAEDDIRKLPKIKKRKLQTKAAMNIVIVESRKESKMIPHYKLSLSRQTNIPLIFG